MKFAGKKTHEEFFEWLNPELTHEQKYDRARLLSECVEVTEKTYWYFLEILPPMHFNGSWFAICEAVTGDIRLGFFKRGKRYFAAHVSDDDKAHSMKSTAVLILNALKEAA